MTSARLVVLCAAALVGLTTGYPFEVPASACVDMLPKGPGHNNEKPLSTEMPFNVTLSRATIQDGQSLEITLSQRSGGPTIAGFMVQVRSGNTPVGTFQPKGDNAKTVSCTSDNDTGSHNSPDPKKSVTLIWTPPTKAARKGNLSVYVTIAKTKLEFWSKRKVGTIKWT